MEKGKERELICQETGMDICSGNRQIYLQILELMLNYEEEGGQKLKEDCEQENWTGFGNEAHALKSSAAGIGAMPLSDAARAMEKAVDASDYDYIKANRDAFFALLADTMVEIRVILEDKLKGVLEE